MTQQTRMPGRATPPQTASLERVSGTPDTTTVPEHPALRLERLVGIARADGLGESATLHGAARLLAIWRSRSGHGDTRWVLGPLGRCADAVERLCRSAEQHRPS